MSMRTAVLVAAVLVLFSVAGIAQQEAVLVGAGDIASCDDLAGAQARRFSLPPNRCPEDAGSRLRQRAGRRPRAEQDRAATSDLN
jgi:hypothetical protein